MIRRVALFPSYVGGHSKVPMAPRCELFESLGFADAAERIGHYPPDEYEIIGREIHVRYPDGSGRSTLGLALDRGLTTVIAARNLPTCEKITAALHG